METKTLEILLGIHKSNYSNDPNIEELNAVVDLLQNNQHFLSFLEKSSFDYYELPYLVFGEIGTYIKMCIEEGCDDKIEAILVYLWKNLELGSKNVQELIHVGFLENLDHFKGDLPKVIKFMPEGLKKYFLKYFSHYLG